MGHVYQGVLHPPQKKANLEKKNQEENLIKEGENEEKMTLMLFKNGPKVMSF